MSSSGRPPARKPPPPQVELQPVLKTLIQSAQETWTYGIFWEPTSGSGSGQVVLSWRDGYYNEVEDDKRKEKSRMTSSAAQQERRKKVLQEVQALVSGPDDPDFPVDEDVTDTEWFFLTSMAQSFKNGGGLLGQVFDDSRPVWVAGLDQIDGSVCDRITQGRVGGLQTMAFIPSANGVVELGSTELLQQNPDLINKVQVLFDFD